MPPKKARKQVTVTEPPPEVDLDLESPDGEVPVQRVKLFTLEGEDYYMVRPKANLMLKVLWKARQEGMLGGMAEMLVQLMGEDTYQVLMDYDDLTDEQLKGVTDRVMHFSTGSMEGLLGN